MDEQVNTNELIMKGPTCGASSAGETISQGPIYAILMEWIGR